MPTLTEKLRRLDDWIHHRFDASHLLPTITTPTRRPITIRRTQSLGDCLAATCVAKALIEQGYPVEFQADPRMHPVLRRVVFPYIRNPHFTISDVPKAPKSQPIPDPDVNLDGAYETDPKRAERHFAEMFTEAANRQLGRFQIQLPYPPKNFAPKMQSIPEIRAQAERIIADLAKADKTLQGESFPRPWVMICPKSWSWANRTVPDATWGEAAKLIGGTKFWLSNNTPPKVKGLVDLNCRHTDLLIEHLSLADVLVSPDTGPFHIACALGIPCVAIKQQSDPALHVSAQRDFIVIEPEGLECLNCQTSDCPIDAKNPPCQGVSAQQIADAVNARVWASTVNLISAVIAVYRPKLENLERCLECVLPQVDEVVICGDLDTEEWPPAVRFQDSKIKWVRLDAKNTGFGKKASRAARESNGSLLMFLNDDVFIEPTVVEQLKAHMADPAVGAVTHTLRYLDGSIQYAGLGRPPGHVGFGHLDHKKPQSRHTMPVEQESLCMASVLVRRKAFFEAGAFDERFKIYSEDASAGLAMRRAGYKLIFDPRPQGIHIEHASTSLMGDISPALAESHRVFAEIWGDYFRRNFDTTKLGTFDK